MIKNKFNIKSDAQVGYHLFGMLIQFMNEEPIFPDFRSVRDIYDMYHLDTKQFHRIASMLESNSNKLDLILNRIE